MRFLVPSAWCLVALMLTGCAVLPERSGYTRIRTGALDVTVRQPQAAQDACTVEVGTNGAVVVYFGSQYNTTGIRESFAAFRPYHFAAIALFLAGLAILLTNYVPNRWGVACIAGAAGLSVFAKVVSSAGWLATALMILAAIAAAFYLAWRRPVKGEVA